MARTTLQLLFTSTYKGYLKIEGTPGGSPPDEDAKLSATLSYVSDFVILKRTKALKISQVIGIGHLAQPLLTPKMTEEVTMFDTVLLLGSLGLLLVWLRAIQDQVKVRPRKGETGAPGHARS